MENSEKVKKHGYGKEKKSRPLMSKVMPTVLLNAQKIAYMRRESINGLINEWLEDYVNKYSDFIEEYDKTNE